MNLNYASDRDISGRYRVSRQSVWRLVKSDPTFPKPIRLTPGCTRWLLSEVEAWEASKRDATKLKPSPGRSGKGLVVSSW